jgi:Flp pilus assembly protein TadB
VVVGLLLMLSPQFVRPLFYDPIGHFLLVAGITQQTVGYFVIKRIIKIQV